MSDESSVGAAVSPTPEEAAERVARGLRASRDRRGERDAAVVRELAVEGLQALDVLVAALRDVRRDRDQARDALRDAEAQLTQGSGSPECHYALGIIRAALGGAAEETP